MKRSPLIVPATMVFADPDPTGPNWPRTRPDGYPVQVGDVLMISHITPTGVDPFGAQVAVKDSSRNNSWKSISYTEADDELRTAIRTIDVDFFQRWMGTL